MVYLTLTVILTKTAIYWNSRNIAVIEVMNFCHLQFVSLLNNYSEARLDSGSFGFQNWLIAGIDPVVEDSCWVSGHRDGCNGDPPDGGPPARLALHVDHLAGHVDLQRVHGEALRVGAVVAHRLAQLRLEEADQLDVAPHVLSLQEEVVRRLRYWAEARCCLL